MKISVHTLVKNEERYLWYAVMSVINHVDEVLLWDTGSTDGSREIEKEIQKRFPEKVKLKFFENVDASGFSVLRQEMLQSSKTDWIFLLDGDEVWWEDSINKVVGTMDKGDCDAIVSPFINPVGDLYHFQEEKAGRYKIDERIGNITIRAFKKNISGLKVINEYGKEGYVDRTGMFIQESREVKRKFVDAPFLHLTHLARSSHDRDVMQRSPKKKYEKGIPFPADFYYPEVFFRQKPEMISSPWKVSDRYFGIRSGLETPFKKLKNKVWKDKT